MDRIQRRAAVVPGRQVALAGANLDVEADEPAGREAELGTIRARHSAVEDDAGVGAALVVTNEIDDRVTPDLLLAVAGDTEVHGERALLPKKLSRLQERVELTLVVGDTAGVVPAVALGELERRRFPELEWRGGLAVVVALDQHRRRGGPVPVRRPVARHALPVSLAAELRLAAGARDAPADP